MHTENKDQSLLGINCINSFYTACNSVNKKPGVLNCCGKIQI